MKTSMIIASACATLALANPAVKRAIKTEIVFEFVTITVTGTGPSPTPDPVVAITTTTTTDVPVVQPATTDASSDQSGNPGAFFSQPASEDPAPTSAPAISVPDTSNLGTYASPILTQHNLHRANHSADPLEWDDYLVNAAQLLASTCRYGHDTSVGGGGYGQNIGADSIGASNVPSMITNGMYDNEMPNYTTYGGEPAQSDLPKYGHFTQIVWKKTTKVGCYTATCDKVYDAGSGQEMKGFSSFTVCNYSPPGNYIGEYGDNVGAPLGQPNIHI